MKKPPVRQTHLATLRTNRERRFESGLKPALDVAGVEAGVFKSRFFQDVALIQNRARGQLFELIAERLLVGHLQRMGLEGADFERQVRFPVDQGIRVADFYVPAKRLIVEVKSGYVTWSRSVRLQAAKDACLLQSADRVGQVEWFLFRGGSPRALAGLAAAGITCYDLGFGGEKSEAKVATVIRLPPASE